MLAKRRERGKADREGKGRGWNGKKWIQYRGKRRGRKNGKERAAKERGEGDGEREGE